MYCHFGWVVWFLCPQICGAVANYKQRGRGWNILPTSALGLNPREEVSTRRCHLTMQLCSSCKRESAHHVSMKSNMENCKWSHMKGAMTSHKSWLMWHKHIIVTCNPHYHPLPTCRTASQYVTIRTRGVHVGHVVKWPHKDTTSTWSRDDLLSTSCCSDFDTTESKNPIKNALHLKLHLQIYSFSIIAS